MRERLQHPSNLGLSPPPHPNNLSSAGRGALVIRLSASRAVGDPLIRNGDGEDDGDGNGDGTGGTDHFPHHSRRNGRHDDDDQHWRFWRLLWRFLLVTAPRKVAQVLLARGTLAIWPRARDPLEAPRVRPPHAAAAHAWHLDERRILERTEDTRIFLHRDLSAV